MSGLPITWETVPLGRVAEFIMGQAPPGSASNFDGRGTPFVKAGEFGLERPITREWTTKPLKFAFEGDVLICVVGATCGKINLGADCAIGRSVAAIRPNRAVDQHFLYRYLMTKVGDLRSGATGSAQGVISREALAEVEIPLAPLSAQQRIVKKLDALFSRTARARDDLDRIPALVSCYKQALLAAAFRGDLTADWRIENEVPPVDLANIERQRQEAWQMEPRSPSRYTPSEDIDWRPTIDLPASWRWASVGQLTFLVQYGSSAKTHAEKSNGIPVLRMGNIVDGKIDYSQMKYLPGSHDEFPVLLLQDGDLLFNRTNSAELVGKTAIYGGPNDAMSFASYLIRLKVVGFIPDLLAAYINSPIGRSWIASTVTQQVGQANVNGSKLKTLGVPVMPPPEQVELWHRISNAFTEIDRLTNEAASARRLLDRLDQAVLAKAFRGELVPQDPADEPASVLLERIRVERAAALEGNRRGRRGTREFGRRPGSLRVGRV